jgi:hypothetical protein
LQIESMVSQVGSKPAILELAALYFEVY